MLSALATQNGDNNYSPPIPGVGTPGDVHPDNAVHYSGRPDADRGRNKDNNYYEGQRLRMVALLPVPARTSKAETRHADCRGHCGTDGM